jgi:hypothetical protein
MASRRLRLRRKTRKSLLARRRRRARISRRNQRGGSMLEIARRYPWASVTTLNEEGVPQTQSVESFYEESDANPEAPAETSV